MTAQPQQCDKEKLIEYLIDEIEHPRCATPRCVCLNLKQKIEYGDFSISAGASAEQVLEGVIEDIGNFVFLDLKAIETRKVLQDHFKDKLAELRQERER